MLKKHLLQNKLMYYIIFILYIFYSFLFIGIVSAKWPCLIKNWPPEVLENYIKDTRTVVKNITSEISKNEWSKKTKSTTNNTNSSLENKLNKDKNEILRIYNSAINWDWFFSSFDYYAVFPITHDVPNEITRDYRKLEKESVWLRKYLEKIVYDGYSDINIENACAWVTNNCQLGWKAVDIIWELIQNNSKVTDLFRQTVTLNTEDFTNTIILVPDNFKLELEKNYWWETIPNCSEEWWFFEQIKEAISKITLLNEQWEKWIQDWKKAWQMMIWTMSDADYAEEEKMILSEELGNQWISIGNNNIIQKNLKKFNWWGWFSENNNFLKNTFDNVTKSVSSQFNAFSDTISDAFKDGKKETSIQSINNTKDDKQQTNEIEKKLAKTFQDQFQFISIDDVGTEKVRAKIINMHTSLSQSSKKLEKTSQISEKVCNDQDRWNWICNK